MAVVCCHSVSLSLFLAVLCLFCSSCLISLPHGPDAPCQTCHHHSAWSRDQSRVIHTGTSRAVQPLTAEDIGLIHSCIITILSVFAKITLLCIIWPINIAVLYLHRQLPYTAALYFNITMNLFKISIFSVTCWNWIAKFRNECEFELNWWHPTGSWIGMTKRVIYWILVQHLQCILGNCVLHPGLQKLLYLMSISVLSIYRSMALSFDIYL